MFSYSANRFARSLSRSVRCKMRCAPAVGQVCLFYLETDVRCPLASFSRTSRREGFARCSKTNELVLAGHTVKNKVKKGLKQIGSCASSVLNGVCGLFAVSAVHTSKGPSADVFLFILGVLRAPRPGRIPGRRRMLSSNYALFPSLRAPQWKLEAFPVIRKTEHIRKPHDSV